MSAIFSDQVLVLNLSLFLLLGSVCGLLAGAALLWRPDLLLRVSKYANRWISTRQMSRSINKSFDMDRWLYRHSQLTGGLLLVSAIYMDYIFIAHFDKASVLASMFKARIVQSILVQPLLDALVLFFLAGAQFALLVSFFLLLRPSILRDFERGANQRISMRQALKPLEIQRNVVDQYTFRNVQLVGVLLIFGSLYTLVALVLWLGR